jgi:hypothetical protein
MAEFKNDVSIFNCVDDQENYEGKLVSRFPIDF